MTLQLVPVEPAQIALLVRLAQEERAQGPALLHLAATVQQAAALQQGLCALQVAHVPAEQMEHYPALLHLAATAQQAAAPQQGLSALLAASALVALHLL